LDYAIFEYVDQKGRGLILEWRKKLQTEQRARLDQKLDMLRLNGPELSPLVLARTTGLIYKLKVKGNVQLRPRLCAGPLSHETEFTLLVPVKEIGGKTVPPDADDSAIERRKEIIDHGETRRCKYEFNVSQ